MAECAVHLAQADHNEGMARFLLDKPFFDWSITAAFYSAIHFFEARLFVEFADPNEKHTETSIPVDSEGKLKFTPHSWREQLIRTRYSKETWKCFRSLRESSQTARYLSNMNRDARAFSLKPAFSVFSEKNARFSVENDLTSVKRELKIDLVGFIHSLEIDKADPIRGALIVGKLLDNFGTRAELLNETKDSLRQIFSKSDIDLLQAQLAKIETSLKTT